MRNVECCSTPDGLEVSFSIAGKGVGEVLCRLVLLDPETGNVRASGSATLFVLGLNGSASATQRQGRGPRQAQPLPPIRTMTSMDLPLGPWPGRLEEAASVADAGWPAAIPTLPAVEDALASAPAQPAADAVPLYQWSAHAVLPTLQPPVDVAVAAWPDTLPTLPAVDDDPAVAPAQPPADALLDPLPSWPTDGALGNVALPTLDDDPAVAPGQQLAADAVLLNLLPGWSTDDALGNAMDDGLVAWLNDALDDVDT